MQAHMKKNLFFCKGKGIFLQGERHFSRTIVSLLQDFEWVIRG